MGGISGIQTLAEIKKIDKGIKVIMVTGRKPEDQEAFDKCKEYGVLDYVHKPLELDELEKVVMKNI